ncbi:hypothetical protein FN846DRAFT_987284 [Sphaerosporella brunnea]|nr:hypothetical protein FN846DRAFT_987284 [Sphaerosporella brunnea]
MLEEVLTATALRRAKERIREEGKPELKPTVDDDEAQKFLRPVVRNIISKLDTLLVGLHKEREHYVKNLIPSSARGDAKRKWDQLKSEAKTQEGGGQPPTTPPRTALSPTPADTEEDLDSEDSEEGGNNKKRKRKAANPGEYEKYLRNRRYRVRLRDWSQVVGMAAIKGWEQGPLERTAAKCAELFAQDMKFRTLGTKSKRGTEWTAKGGLSEDSAARDGGSFLEEVCVSWGHQKSKISAKKDSRRLRKQTKGDTDSVVETGDGASPSPSSEVNGGA